jgi:hypothetical protein
LFRCTDPFAAVTVTGNVPPVCDGVVVVPGWELVAPLLQPANMRPAANATAISRRVRT